jgi:RNA polymerase sigma-70 factor (ECF subfamily)
MLSVGPADDEARLRSGLEDDHSELVRRAQLGSAAAFEQLVLRHGPNLHRYLALRLGNDGDARDTLQETLFAAWQGLPRLKQARKFWPWLVGIAAHKAADAVRHRMTVGDRELELLGQDDDSAIEIHLALGALPPHFREVLLLRYGLQLSEEEVAEVLGVRVGTVKSRSARARVALLELLR